MHSFERSSALLKWARRHQFASTDYYWKEGAIYPMALGYFLRAACALYRIRGEDEHGATAKEILGLLQSRSNLLAASHYPHWGLPFPWPTLEDARVVLSGDFFWDAGNPLFTGPLPAHHGYGVTTAIAGQGLLDYADCFPEASLEDWLEGVGRWCLEDCGYRMIEGKVFFHYSPRMRHEIYNGSALVAAFLARAGAFLGKTKWIDLAESAMELMVRVQDEEGGWPYARERQEIEYHYGYNLESLAIFLRVRPNAEVEGALRRGADYYWERLIDPDGKCYDLVDKATETRLWAYGWAISAFCHCLEVSGEKRYLEYARQVAAYMETHLWDPEAGAYRFKRDDPSHYMRDEAHAAYGMARLAKEESRRASV